ncbi:hypothetical protein CGLO_05042 [Colletotrichum gloeosporioides Cg-14]|uniref:Uncharacterized protein n=1 Tax=Colletotrichum gloeosporioides (strain Cg-14) TaxID=1237896 RepID=T0KIA3_COLGC|nr:hypothetical protein CGLO_05042 [Colletotrichum gloeosporioides Cg-14]
MLEVAFTCNAEFEADEQEATGRIAAAEAEKEQRRLSGPNLRTGPTVSFAVDSCYC